MSPLTSSKSATAGLLMLLLAVTVAPTFATASTSKRTPMPAACLRAASKLCMGSSTNAMNCLKQLTKAGDSRVSQACTSALAEQASTKPGAPRPKARTETLASLGRLLTESTCVTVDVTASARFQMGGYTCGQLCCNSPNGNACCNSTTTVVISHVTTATCAGMNHNDCVPN